MSAPDVCPVHGVIDCPCIFAPEHDPAHVRDEDELDDDTDPDFWPDGCDGDDESAEELELLGRAGIRPRTKQGRRALRDVFQSEVGRLGDLEATYLVIDHGARVEYLWTGANARRAHAALARVFAKAGVDALDVPGAGVWTAKGATA